MKQATVYITLTNVTKQTAIVEGRIPAAPKLRASLMSNTQRKRALYSNRAATPETVAPSILRARSINYGDKGSIPNGSNHWWALQSKGAAKPSV